MKGINRADKTIRETKLYSENKENNTPCIFISYQRKDETFAEKVAEYIKNQSLDVYFDKYDIPLNKTKNPLKVTDNIKKGLSESNYMLVVISKTTYKSVWVPFEIGYAYDKMDDKMKLLRHKNQIDIPQYLKVKEMLNNYLDFRNFIQSIKDEDYTRIYEVQNYYEFTENPLNEYLD